MEGMWRVNAALQTKELGSKVFIHSSRCCVQPNLICSEVLQSEAPKWSSRLQMWCVQV